MESRLTREPERGTAVPEAEGNAINQLRIVDTGSMGRLELPLELRALAVSAQEEIPLDPLEIAVDVFHRRDRLDAVNGGHVTLGCQSGALAAVQLLDVVVAVVESRGEMRGRATRLATAYGPIVDQDDSAAGAREKIGGCHSGYSRSNDADVRAQILGKRLELRNFGCVHPDGGRVT